MDIKKIKLMVTDLDGTILSTNALKKETLEMIEKFSKEGIVFCPATGRSIPDLNVPMKASKPYPEYIICLNGSVLRRNGEVIYGEPIERNDVKFIMDFFKKNRIINGFYSKDWIYEIDDDEIKFERITVILKEMFGEDAFGDDTWLVENLKKVKELEDIKEDIYKFETWVIDTSKTEGYVKELAKNPNIEVSTSDAHTIEITRKGVSKGKTMEFLMDYLHLDKDEVITCGDASNDLSMMNSGTHIICPSNAIDEIKNKAEVITGACKDAGVEKYLLSLFD